MLIIGIPLLIALALLGLELTRTSDAPVLEPSPTVGFELAVGKSNAQNFAYAPLATIALQGCKNPVRVVVEFDLNTPAYEALVGTEGYASLGFGVIGSRISRLSLWRGNPSASPSLDAMFAPRPATVLRDAVTPDAALRLLAHGKGFVTHRTRVGIPSFRGLDARIRLATGVASQSFYAAFLADWIRPRTHGTCYVFLPDLRGDALLVSQGLLYERWHLEARAIETASEPGQVSLTGWQGAPADLPERVVGEDSTKPPRSLRFPTWYCDQNGAAALEGRLEGTCEGYVALADANATGSTATETFIVGTFFGVAIAAVLQSLLSFRAEHLGFGRKARRV